MFFQSLVCFARVTVACWEGTGLRSIPPRVSEGFVFPKETRTYKQGESWRCPVVRLLKRMLGRAQQLWTAQGISLISVKCYCCQHRPGVNGGTWWDENCLKYREKKAES